MKVDLARQDDIPTLAEVSGLAFADDTHTALKSVANGYGSRPADVARFHSDGMQGAFSSWLENPKQDIVVVRDQNDGVVGFAVWAKFGYEAGREPSATENRKLQSVTAQSIPPPSNLPKDGSKNVANLGQLTNAAMTYYVDQLRPPGSLCRYIVSISVHPSHQGKGIGKTLINWGLEKAAREGAYCWVSGNGNSMAMFSKQGFVEVGRLEVCLDDWAEGLKPVQEQDGSSSGDSAQGHNWGNYVWNWMRWDPPTT